MRDHSPVVIDQFNGLWMKGDPESTPIDHFSSGQNFQFIARSNGIKTRDGIDRHQNVVAPLGNVVRVYNYITQSQNTLLALTWDGTTGKIYHVVNSTTIYGPILTKVGMEDFAFVPWAGRAYISPFKSYVVNGLNVEKGLSGEFLYVYDGTGTASRKAAGTAASGTLVVANGSAGTTDTGLHVFAVVGETDTGYLSPPIAFATFTLDGTHKIDFSAIPVFVGSQWIKRHIVSSIKVPTYNGNPSGYTLYFIPSATINNNVGTTLSGVEFFDGELLENASHLADNFAEIPAGAVLNIYHGRLLVGATYNDISIVLVSEEGEPEAINQISGFLVVPLDGNAITNAQEMRDVLFVTKRNRIVSYVDNGDVPSSWPSTIVDQAIGAPVHGIATVIDSGGTSIDFLIFASYAGIIIFNGRIVKPELTFKIDKGLWLLLDRNNFRKIQIVIDPIKQMLYCVLPDGTLLVGDYSNGLDAKNIRWVIWTFNIRVTAIALVNINDLIIAGDAANWP
jgi:hypothetical protein